MHFFRERTGERVRGNLEAAHQHAKITMVEPGRATPRATSCVSLLAEAASRLFPALTHLADPAHTEKGRDAAKEGSSRPSTWTLRATVFLLVTQARSVDPLLNTVHACIQKTSYHAGDAGTTP